MFQKKLKTMMANANLATVSLFHNGCERRKSSEAHTLLFLLNLVQAYIFWKNCVVGQNYSEIGQKITAANAIVANFEFIFIYNCHVQSD